MATSQEEHQPDLSTVLQLLDLRAVLDAAIRYVKTPGELQGSVGLVLLDGAVERAVYLAGNAKGAFKNSKDGLDDILIRLVHQDSEVSVGSAHVSSVRKLHRCRNAAQHEGVRYDQRELPQWLISVPWLISWLVRTTFDVELSDLSLSAAVQDEQFRSELEDAERRIEEADWKGAVKQAKQTMNEAFKAWAGQTGGRARLDTNTRVIDPSLRRPLMQVEELVEELRKATLVSQLATDASEAAWFVPRWTGGPINWSEDDSRRFVAFVVNWVVAFEGTPARQRLYRIDTQLLARRDVRVGEEPARIESVQVYSVHENSFRIRSPLRSLPKHQDSSTWTQGAAAFVKEYLGHGAHLNLSPDGTLDLIGIPLARSNELPAILGDLITAGEKAIHDKAVETKEKLARLQAEEARFRESLAPILENPPAQFQSVIVRRMGREFELEVSPIDSRWATQIVPREHGGLHVYEGTHGLIVTGKLTADSVMAALNSISEAIEMARATAEAKRIEKARITAEIESALDEAGFTTVDGPVELSR